jgi:putative DNA primase/helicase
MKSSLFDIDAVRFWLDFLHGDSRGYIHVCSTGDWTGRSFDLHRNETTDQACAYIQDLEDKNREGIYLRMTTIPFIADGRGRDSDSISFPGLWADIDLAGPGHKTTKPLPADEAAARLIIEEAGLPEPTLWVHSGGGLYPYWLLDQPYQVKQDPDKISALQELSSGWQRCLGEAAERLGLFYGTQCGDLSRVLRVPGTVNRKADLERPCRIIDQSGRLYSITELVEAFTEASAKLRVADDRGSYDRVPTPVEGSTPFDVFESETGWDHQLLLGGADWRVHHNQGGTTYWTRPGKRAIDGHSATTGRAGDRDRLYMFSDADTLIPAGGPYTKGYVYALLHHNGDLSKAAKHLKSLGFGGTSNASPLPDTLVLQGQQAPVAAARTVQLVSFPNTDTGNGKRMHALYGDKFKYVTDKRKWAQYDGLRWQILDNADPVKYHAALLAEQMLEEGKAIGDDDEYGKALIKWAKASTADARTNASVSNFRMLPGVSVRSNAFDVDPRYVGVGNGVLDLGEPGDGPKLLAPDPKYMITKTMAASYRPEVEATRWTKFMEEILPDPELRGYLQRLAGYSLRGRPNRRAMAILSGPPRSGKSKFIESMGHTFGDYGGTAAASLFRSKRDTQVNTTDLHHLRGRRFVSTSESSESTVMDEELVKRVTGLDKVNSRDLYESPQEWLPQFVLFMATNHHPKVNPEDAATWDRLKVVRFEQEFRGEGDDPELLDKLIEEADGILNWLLEGMMEFDNPSIGLNEPESVTQAGNMYRRENDNVSQFIDSCVEEHVLLAEETGEIQHATLYSMYDGWCNSNKMGNPLGSTKFGKRLASLGFERTSAKQWQGLRIGSHGMLGRMG